VSGGSSGGVLQQVLVGLSSLRSASNPLRTSCPWDEGLRYGRVVGEAEWRLSSAGGLVDHEEER
jgi:hypothetical protein